MNVESITAAGEALVATIARLLPQLAPQRPSHPESA
jgi:hypothetical protein